jgi:acyl carrier protein
MDSDSGGPLGHPPSPTEAKLQEIVAAKLKISPDHVPLDQSLLQDLGLDSFDLVEVVLEIEHRFPFITLMDKSADEFQTLRDVAAYIDRGQSPV